MESPKDLEKKLKEIDGNGYGAYNEIKGRYRFDLFDLEVVHVQGDPYASPSKFKIHIPHSNAKFPPETYENRRRRIALEDYLVRKFSEACREIAQGNRGSGKSGLLTTLTPGQAMIPRTTAEVRENKIVLRFVAGLPARGRTPLSAIQAREMLLEEVPEIVKSSLLYENQDPGELKLHVETKENAAWIRDRLKERGLMAFVADSAKLPRQSGVSDEPMEEDVVPFESPESLRVEFNPPNIQSVTGMGIPEGVTLIVGGGYNGKSTLLNALGQGVYDHIPQDGREYVVTVRDAVRIRAEDGRFVENVDITPFIGEVPGKLNTEKFSTEDASGSTSQAANIMEALEAGSSLLLIDEDTSATNLMIRDARMQELVSEKEEPITPLIDRIKQLYEDKNVSSVLVMGGTGEYFDVADTVIKMDTFLPREVTEEARSISKKYGKRRSFEGGESFGKVKHRIPDPKSIDPRRGGKGKVKIRARGDTIQFGYEDIDLSRVAQISERSQIRSIGDAIFHISKNWLDGDTELREALNKFEELVEEDRLMEIAPYDSGEYGAPRKFEVAAALNRLRTLKCHPE